MQITQSEEEVLLHEFVWTLNPSLVLFLELLGKSLHSNLDSSGLLERNLDRLLEDHVRTVVHLHGAEPQSKLRIR